MESSEKLTGGVHPERREVLLLHANAVRDYFLNSHAYFLEQGKIPAILPADLVLTQLEVNDIVATIMTALQSKRRMAL